MTSSVGWRKFRSLQKLPPSPGLLNPITDSDTANSDEENQNNSESESEDSPPPSWVLQVILEDEMDPDLLLSSFPCFLADSVHRKQ